jgi:hypothetical protein
MPQGARAFDKSSQKGDTGRVGKGRASKPPKKRAAQQQHAIQKRLTSGVHKRIEKDAISKTAGSLAILKK